MILGLHVNFLNLIDIATNRIIIGGWKYVECLIVLLLMVPIIILIRKKLPVLYGKNRKF